MYTKFLLIPIVSLGFFGFGWAAKFDQSILQTTWLQWINDERSANKLPAYTLNNKLNATAQERSDNLNAIYSDGKKVNAMQVHQRKSTDGYYNYNSINGRFAERGLVFQNINRATHTENIGRGYFRCKSEDCTQTIINATKSTLQFYLNEKGRLDPKTKKWIEAGLHYKSLVKKDFTQIGVGISIDRAKGRYYLTIHYGTPLIARATPKK